MLFYNTGPAVPCANQDGQSHAEKLSSLRVHLIWQKSLMFSQFGKDEFNLDRRLQIVLYSGNHSHINNE